MPGTQTACVICHRRINNKADRRPISSIKDNMIKLYLSREYDEKTCHIHVVCAATPHKYMKTEEQRMLSNGEEGVDIENKYNDLNNSYTLNDLADLATKEMIHIHDKENIPPPKRSIQTPDAFTPEEQHHILKRLKTHHTNHDGTLSLQSANHKTVKLLPLPTPHVGSSTCSSKTRQRRSATEEMVLQTLSSPATSTSQQQSRDEQTQLTSLIQRNPEIVTSAAEAAGIPILHKLSVDDMIQLEKLTFIPYNTMRLIRSFLNSHRLPILPSEHQVRQRVAEMIQECEVGSTVMVIDDKEENIIYARTSNVKNVICNHLQQLSSTQQLVQHSNMPPNTFFIQTQSDKGGDSTKLCIQALNRTDVNSVHHLIPVACYEGVGENYDVASQVFKPIFDQLSHPSTSTSTVTASSTSPIISPSCTSCSQHASSSPNTYTPMVYNPSNPTDVMIAADMKMMRMLIGCQSSAACHNFCPMCLVTRDDIVEGRVHAPTVLPQYSRRRRNRRLSFPHRTTALQHRMYNQFMQRAHGNIALAKDYGNVIHSPLISTEIHQHMAAFPLHILLGTTKKAMDIIGEMCTQHDAILQQHKLLPEAAPSSPTRKHVKDSIRTSLSNISWHDQCTQQCQEQMQQHSKGSDMYFQYLKRHDRAVDQRKSEEWRLQELEEKWYNTQGHFARALDDAITRLKVKRQRYHGGAFVGNDCARLLKGRDDIADVLKPRSFESQDGKIKHMIGSQEQSTLALELLSRLYALHALYSLARPLCDHEVDNLTSLCHEFGNWFPISFPKHRITPKMHVMIYHMPELAQKYRTVGMFSEHAGEAIHTVFNKLNRQYVYLGSDLKRLDSVMNRCLRLHDPRVLEFVPSRPVK